MFIQTKLEEICSEIPNQNYDPDEDKVQIAQITMAYDNAQIIRRLNERGLLIKQEKWKLVHEKNAQILKEIQDQTLLDKLQRPVSVFATFRSEEGYQRACHYNDKELPQRPVCGQVLELQEASEPTDIIWENRHFTPAQRNKKRLPFQQPNQVS